MTILTAAGIVLATFRSEAAPMPEFGKSVAFDKSGPDVSISKLRGKAVLIIFFQSWCGICNGWSPKLIKQVEETHGNNRAVVLIAIKTDGGGVTGAREYLKSKGADLDKWCVGADEKAAYFKRVHGKEELWCYALVDGKGDMVAQGQAGTYRTVAGQDTFTLADKNLTKKCGKLETLLPADKEYPSELGKAVRLAEMGCLGQALALCAPGKLRAKDTAALAGLKQDLLAVAETRLRGQMDILKNAAGDGGGRYAAYQELTEMVKELGALPAAREAGALLAQARSDPVIQKERAAETAYTATLQRLEKASSRDKPRVLKELEMLAKKFEGTHSGRLAAETVRSHSQTP